MNTKITNIVEQWIRPQVRALSAYHVPEVGNRIKLDAMETPTPGLRRWWMGGWKYCVT